MLIFTYIHSLSECRDWSSVHSCAINTDIMNGNKMIKSTFDKKSQMTCWCNRNLQRKNILKLNICIFIHWSIKFQQLPPPLLPQGTNEHLTVVHIREGHLNHTWMGLGTSTESASLSIGTNTWFRTPDTYILDLNHHWRRVQFAGF